VLKLTENSLFKNILYALSGPHHRLSSFSYKIQCNEVLHLIYWVHPGFDTWPVKRKIALRSVWDDTFEKARFKVML
jgi:hypothetical protein